MIVINNSLCIDIMHNWKCIAILPTTTSSAWCCALELLPSHLVSGPVCTSRSALSRPYHSSVLDLDPYEVHGLSPEYSAHGKRAAQSHYTSYEAEAEMCWKYMRSLLTPAITSFTLVTFIKRTVCIDLSVSLIVYTYEEDFNLCIDLIGWGSVSSTGIAAFPLTIV